MKTLTCKQMGGPCETPIKGADEKEMMDNGMKHIEEAHPEMAADIKAMPMDDPKMKEWGDQFKKTWAETPDDQ